MVDPISLIKESSYPSMGVSWSCLSLYVPEFTSVKEQFQALFVILSDNLTITGAYLNFVFIIIFHSIAKPFIYTKLVDYPIYQSLTF